MCEARFDTSESLQKRLMRTRLRQFSTLQERRAAASTGSCLTQELRLYSRRARVGPVSGARYRPRGKLGRMD